MDVMATTLDHEVTLRMLNSYTTHLWVSFIYEKIIFVSF